MLSPQLHAESSDLASKWVEALLPFVGQAQDAPAVAGGGAPVPHAAEAERLRVAVASLLSAAPADAVGAAGTESFNTKAVWDELSAASENLQALTQGMTPEVQRSMADLDQGLLRCVQQFQEAKGGGDARWTEFGSWLSNRRKVTVMALWLESMGRAKGVVQAQGRGAAA
jgi:hypothetical protein